MNASQQRHHLPRPGSAAAPRPRSATVAMAAPRAVRPSRTAAQIAELAPASALATGCLCFEDEFGGFIVAPIPRHAMRIGRSIVADIAFEDPTVSRRHVLVARDGDRVRVLDDRSQNGVFVNGARVRSRVLEHGDVVRVGRHHLHFAHLPELRAGERAGARELQAA